MREVKMVNKTENNDYLLWKVSYILSYYLSDRSEMGVSYIVAKSPSEAIKKAKRAEEVRMFGSKLKAEVCSEVSYPKLRLPQDIKKFSLELIVKEKKIL